MRTKTLLLAAAVTAAGIAAIQAQSNIYSVNVVGYYNIVLTGGGAPNATTRYKCVTIQLQNPLIATPTLNNMVTNAPGGSVLGAHLWVQTGFGGFTGLTDFDGTSWAENGDTPLGGYGAGFMLKNLSASDITVTFVGEVPQGALQNHWTTDVNLRGSQVPLAGGITSNLGFSNVLQVAQKWNDPGPGWNSQNQYLSVAEGWESGEPQLGVGEALVIRGTTHTWDRTFSVQ